jgi:hypothetical protein
MAGNKKGTTARKPLSEADKAARQTQRHDNFLRVGEKRVNKAISSIRGIGKLSGSNYAPTEQEVAYMLDTLANELRKVQQAFASGPKAAAPSFTFPGAEQAS